MGQSNDAEATPLVAGTTMKENPAYLSQQIITCLGNKRSLLGYILSAVEYVKEKLGKKNL